MCCALTQKVQNSALTIVHILQYYSNNFIICTQYFHYNQFHGYKWSNEKTITHKPESNSAYLDQSRIYGWFHCTKHFSRSAHLEMRDEIGYKQNYAY